MSDCACSDRQAGDTWREEDGLHIDVRGLAPPEPMIHILQLIDSRAANVVIAHLDREPIFLYPELSDRDCSYEVLGSCGHSHCEDIKLRIERLAP